MTIEVEITPQTSGGLKVITRIPSYRPCRLEGKNGIGKSVAIKLLSLVSGRQPYAGDEASWRSLKKLLGPTSVSVAGLSGTYRQATLTFTTGSWPDKPTMDIGDWIGRLTLDGEERPATELFPLLDVVHLVGTERLSQTLDRRNDIYKTAIASVADKIRALEEARVELAEQAEELQFLSPHQAALDQSERQLHVRENRNLQPLITALDERTRNLGEASSLKALIDASFADGRQEKLDSLRIAHREAMNAVTLCEQRLRKAVRSLGEGTKAQKAVALEERNLSKLKDQREKDLLRLSELARVHPVGGMDIGDESLSKSDVEKLRDHVRQAQSSREQMEHEQHRLQMTESERVLRDEFRLVLEAALARGLGDYVLVNVHERNVTVTQLLSSLSHPPRPRDPKLIDDAELALLKIEAGLNEILKIHLSKSDFDAKLTTISEKLERLRGEVPGQDLLQETVKVARAEHDLAVAKVRTLSQQLGALQRGGLPESEIEGAQNDITSILDREGIEIDELSQSLTNAHAELAKKRELSKALSREISEIDNRFTRRSVERRALLHGLGHVEKLRWLSRIAGNSHGQDTEADEWWQKISDHVNHANRVFHMLSNEVYGLEDVANSGGQDGKYGEAIVSLVESDALDDLAEESIAEVLFENGTLDRIDLKAGTVTWTTRNGQPRTRPLNAFSSGEQALGFMRARLRQLADQESMNRLVFLDEFGAFISADRRRPLAELLSGGDFGSLATQIVVVLPLQADYQSEVRQTTGDLNVRYARRAQQLESQDYFTEVFSS